MTSQVPPGASDTLGEERGLSQRSDISTTVVTGVSENMSAPAHTKFTAETIAIAQVASVILSQAANLSTKMTYNAACRHAYLLLVAARDYQEQRAELVTSGKVQE